MFIISVELIGSFSAFFAGNIKYVYNNLHLPPFSPPDFLFGIVWPFLYLLIGIAGFIIWHHFPDHRRVGLLSIYGVQLFINFIWSIVFFNLEYYWLGFLLILVLDLLVLICIIQFTRLNKVAGFLLYPYFIWLLFATYLTFGVAWLN
ncbi:sensory protein [Liquorilactobacillus capillatus DSM 19910]|uniref:Sensory protein n=2 Tax=Liquorilactobacillus capillatus TaxID=480931 RepID=A0A0R1MFQ4_9LACO|nr:sensory protein [Liquorilactobacillus capillatus DSM 19910]